MTQSLDARLRDLEAGDSGRLLAWRNLPEIRRWMYTDHEITAAEHARWFAGVFGDDSRRYWIIEVDGRPAGLTHLTGISPQHRRAAMGYYVAEPALRGRGVGAFAKFRAIEHAFGELGLDKLWAEALADNHASIALLESLGFRREALLRHHVIKAGAPVDVVGLGLLAGDWRAGLDATRARLRAKGLPV